MVIPPVDRRATLHGREEEMEAIATVIRELPLRAPRVVLVNGPAGIGKSRLIAEALDASAHSRHGSRWVAGAGPVNFPAAADEASIVVVDDLDLAESAAVAAIDLRTRSGPPPLLWIIIRRPTILDAPHETLWAALRRRGATTMNLGALTTEQSISLAQEILGLSLGADVRQLIDVAAGNPRRIIDLVDAATAGDHFVHRAGAVWLRESDESREWLLHAGQVDAVSSGARDLLNVAAVLGRHVAVDHLTSVGRVPAVTVLRQLDELAAAGILRGDGEAFEFQHEVLRHEIQRSIPPQRRRLLHERAAHALSASRASPIDIAAHLIEAAEPHELSLRSLEVAAAAQIVVAPVASAQLFRRAWELTPPDAPAIATRRRFAVWAACWSGRFDDQFEVATSSVASDEEPDAELADAELMARHLRGEVVSLMPVVARSSRGRRAHLGRPALACLAASLRLGAGQPRAAFQQAERALPVAQRAHRGDLAEFARRVMVRAKMIEGDLGDAAEQSRGLTHEAATTMVVRAQVAMAEGQIDLGIRLSADARRRADGVHPWVVPELDRITARGMLELASLDAAATAAELAVAGAKELQHNSALTQAIALVARIAILRGEFDQARDAVSQLRHAASAGAPVDEPGLTEAVLAAVTDEPGLALSVLEQHGTFERMRVGAGLVLEHTDVVPTLLRLTITAHRPTRTADLVGCLQRLAARNPRIRWISAIHRYALARSNGNHLEASAAADDLRSSGLVLTHLLVVHDLAEMSGDRRQRSRAARLLAARGVLGLVTSQSRSAEVRGLTAAEEAVARLVATGMTNKQVAQQLFISVHTVDTTLRRIFAKLGVRSRVELARHFDT